MTDHGESKLKNRIIFKLTGCWPQSVVSSRLANTTWDPSTVNAIMRDVYEQAGAPVPPEYLDDRRVVVGVDKATRWNRTAIAVIRHEDRLT